MHGGLQLTKCFATLQDYINSSVHPVLIISYEMFLRTHEALSKVSFDLMVCDEGHRLKNTAIKTTLVSILSCVAHGHTWPGIQHLYTTVFDISTQILGSVPVLRRIVLTGTPIQVKHWCHCCPLCAAFFNHIDLSKMLLSHFFFIQNDLQEFYSIVDFCNPGILGS